MCSSSRCYEDILAPRRDECSNFMWASRHIKPKVAYQQPARPTPQYHKDEVLRSPKIQELLEMLSKENNVDKEVLEVQVRAILDEIGYNKKLKVIRWLGLVLVKICGKICTGIYINRRDIEQVKSQMGGCPVIFVPSHRSYADFILLSLIFFSEDLAIPAIAAGMDFHGMWGMGTMLRDTGAFFMRRSYNNDGLYWNTFKQYVHQLVTKGEIPIEFFIEGTRSRSNKSLTPKYGLILMILKAFFLAQVPDIWFVPVNISYDRILEEKLFAFELLGVPKPKESTSGFFKSLSILKESYGSIYFDMGEPISVKKFFGASADRSAHSLRPIHHQEITENEKQLIPALAHEIVYKQQKHCVVTTFNLVAIILNNNLVSGKSLLTFEELLTEVIWLKSVVEALGGFVERGDTKTNLLAALNVHQNVVQIHKGTVTLVFNDVVLDRASVGKLKAHDLSEKTLTLCVPFMMLQLYINPVLHYLVDVGILVTILKHSTRNLSEDDLFGRYHFLRALLSQEFITFSPREKTDFKSAIEHSLDLNLLSRCDDLYTNGQNQKCEEVIYNCFDGFIFTYFIVCVVLLQTPEKTAEEKSILVRVQTEVEVLLNGDAFIHPYSLSLDTISNCLSTLVNHKSLVKIRDKNSVLYEINHVEISTVKGKLEEYIAPTKVLQRKLESVQLHLKTKL